jgi:MtaA/CmuA family methyltransferase
MTTRLMARALPDQRTRAKRPDRNGRRYTLYTPKEEIIRVLRGEDIGYYPRPIPVFTPTVEMMREKNAFFPAANYEAEPMAELALAAHEIGRWHCIMIPWASTVEMEALGCEVLNRDDDIAGYPQFKKRAFEDANDVRFGTDILTKRPFPAVMEATRIAKKRIEESHKGAIPIVSMTQGPFTIAGYTIGINEMFKHMIKDRERAGRVLDVISDLNIVYANEMLKNGGDVLLMSDPAAEGLTPKQFDQIVLPVYRKIADGVSCPKMLHICGKTGKLLDLIPDSGFDGYSFDYPAVDVSLVTEKLKGRIRTIGSVPTVTHLLEGSEEEVIEITNFMMESGVDLLSPSCGLPQYTPTVNVQAMAKAIEIYNEKKHGVKLS